MEYMYEKMDKLKVHIHVNWNNLTLILYLGLHASTAILWHQLAFRLHMHILIKPNQSSFFTVILL